MQKMQKMQEHLESKARELGAVVVGPSAATLDRVRKREHAVTTTPT